ncbi:2,3-butanediol dehydrogenase [Bifidobacterium sp. ESL0790]|uniref:2,3-butanediol dehydrogenase n=1 Tax=Bifidobacterium sp. ESL0790 TaxID=2983233 RepID=UPI0023F7A193|nr:2,3-butanediol dehydrogenase [Bifidobacterium sp. ESL0790]WEV72727.1 2,3-butanediol dehydrogenase [Bifidobacterium sp. ESL0790]
MKAVQYYGKEHIQIDDIPEPQLKPGTIKVRPAYTGICGSDLHMYYNGPESVSGNVPGHPHPISGESIPVVLGHEFSGTVEEIADDVDTDLKVGDHVCIESMMACGECPSCKAGHYNTCDKVGGIGINGRGGGMSEHVVVEARFVHGVGDIPLDQAALLEPFTVAYHAVRRSGAKAGQTAVVGGAGPVGLMLGAVLKAKGLKVIMSELSEVRKKTAKETGVADIVVDPSKEDLAARVKAETDGAGADVGFDASGAGVVVHQLIAAVRESANVMIVAIHVRPLELNVAKELTRTEKNIMTSLAYCNDHPDSIKLVQDKHIDLSPFITDKIKAEDLVEKGLKQLRDDGEHHVKILVEL